MRRVIYTCITSGYDNLKQPAVIDDSFDYICFCDDVKVDKVGVWQMRPIPFENDNNTRRSRYVKLLPHRVLPEYDYSLYMDANVTINDVRLYEILNEKIALGIPYSGLNHWGRDCAYEECVGCLNTVKEKLTEVLKTIKFLKNHHFAKHFGLYENNVILRKHNDDKVKYFDELWWHLYMKLAKRDQLCHPFCYQRAGLEFDYLLPTDKCARNHPYFEYVKHPNIKTERSFFEQLCYDVRRKTNVSIARIYLSL